jgi:tetratricopeptide (TPR) repeat protein
MADSFLHEAALRKKGYHFEKSAVNPLSVDYVMAPFNEMTCFMDPRAKEGRDIMALFTFGVQFYQGQRYDTARMYLRRVVNYDQHNPLAYHYLGKIAFDQGRYEEAQLMFKMAGTYYLEEDQFNVYCDSVIRSVHYPYDHKCYEDYFKAKHYKVEEDNYFLADIYEKWSRVDEAEECYRQLIVARPEDALSNLLYSNLLESSGRWAESERVIMNYAEHDNVQGSYELNAFYRRAISDQPENADWYYRLGLYLYKLAKEPTSAEYIDSVFYFQSISQEVFIDTSNVHEIGKKYSWDRNIKEIMDIPVGQKDPTLTNRAITVPGTLKRVPIADPIEMPRKDAILYLHLADSLINDANISSDLQNKIGNVYLFAGSKKMAFPHFINAVALDTNNVSARLNIVNAGKNIYKNREVLKQLNWFDATGKMDFERRLLMANYSLRAGEFDKAKRSLDTAENEYPGIHSEILESSAAWFAAKKDFKNAVLWYNDLLNMQPNDPVVLYNLARSYAQTGNKTSAWRYLTQSMKNGFHFGYVLDEDYAWASFRNDSRWKDLRKKYPDIKYKEPVTSGN